MPLPPEYDRVLTDLVSDLNDYQGEGDQPWTGLLDLAMGTAWDRLAQLGPPPIPGQR